MSYYSSKKIINPFPTEVFVSTYRMHFKQKGACLDVPSICTCGFFICYFLVEQLMLSLNFYSWMISIVKSEFKRMLMTQLDNS